MKYVHLIVRNAQWPRPFTVVVAVALMLVGALSATAAANSADVDVGKSSGAKVGETYHSTLKRLNSQISGYRVRVENSPASWLERERLANAYFERAKLTGQFDHFVEADKAMQRMTEVSKSVNNGALSRAGLNYTLHRLAEVETDLQRAEEALLIKATTRQRIEALRADVALQQGRYADAFVAYRALDEQSPSTESAFRLANYYLQIGDETSFDRSIAIASERVLGKSPQLRAWLHLQQGIADLGFGRYDNALAHYNDALALYPGYWLVEEHIAEIDVIQGRLELAETKYRDLIERTDSPMFRLALAEVLELRSTELSSDDNATAKLTQESFELTTEAMAQLETSYDLIPESMAGHALEVSLQLGAPDEALALAKHNHEIRPSGQASVLLAQAYARLGDFDTAQETLESALVSVYHSPELFATASVVYQARGEDALAAEFSKRAVALKHDAMDDVEWLVN